MSLQDKINSAEPSDWLTEGLSPKKVARLMKRAVRNAYIRLRAMFIIEKAKRIIRRGQKRDLQWKDFLQG